jgi:diguanylate cyclase
MTGAGVENAMAVVEKLRTAVEGCGFHYKGQQVPITISCGMTQFRAGDSVESAFERADQALYQAKENGRNRCVSADAN